MCPNSLPLYTRCPPNSVLLHARSAQLAGYSTHASHAATASPHAAVIPPPNPHRNAACPFAASLRIKLMAVYLAEDINATTLQVNPNPNRNPNPNPNRKPNPDRNTYNM